MTHLSREQMARSRVSAAYLITFPPPKGWRSNVVSSIGQPIPGDACSLYAANQTRRDFLNSIIEKAGGPGQGDTYGVLLPKIRAITAH